MSRQPIGASLTAEPVTPAVVAAVVVEAAARLAAEAAAARDLEGAERALVAALEACRAGRREAPAGT